MDTTFRLPSLRLGTDFDGPVVPLEVPGTLSRGSDPSLCMLDGASRAPHRLSRLVRPVGLLGVKLAQPRTAVRITLRLLVDDLSTMMWDRHSFRLQGEPMPEEEEYVPTDVSHRHRQVEVTAQGRTRALALLALRPPDEGTVRQHVRFEVSAEEIGDSGLVMVGLEHPRRAPDWATRNELEDPLVGLCIARMVVEPIEERVPAHVSTGRPAVEGTFISPANPGYFVLNPPADGGPVDLTLAVRGAGGERLLGRRAKAKHPLRAARELAQDRQLATSAPAVVEVVDLGGETIVDTTVEESDDRYRLAVPAGTGPVFVRARKIVGGEPTSVNWGVRVKRRKD